MAFYSDELIEEVRSRNDIVDVISGYVNLQKKGSTYFGLCPFHNEKTGSFSVSRNKQMFYCFGCGAGGNVLTFIMKYENFTFPEAMQMLADRAGITLPKQEMTAQQRKAADRRTRLLEIQKEAAVYYHKLLYSKAGERALDYFHRRALTDETIRRFGLGYSTIYSDDLYLYLKKKGYEDDLLKDSGLVTFSEQKGGHDKFWNRAMFPIMDVNNRVIGFGGRVMGDGEPKYLNSPETMIFDKSRNLYGLNYARSSRKEQILLCEGYMDVIALHQAGFDNAVASLGTSFTSGHANLLRRYTNHVCCTFDSDGAGRKAALRAIPILKEAGLSAKVIDMTPYKDPDEFIKALGADAFQERIDQAENSFLFEIRMLERDYDLADPEQKTAFFRAAARRILQFPDQLERENYIEAIASIYQIGFENLRGMVRSEGTKGGITRTREVPVSGIQKVKKEDGSVRSQKLLLTWMADRPELYQAVKKYIGPDDFSDELMQKVAGELFAQLEKGELNPARIISDFPEEEQQKEAASIFHAQLASVDTPKEQEKALREILIRMMQDRLEERRKHLEPGDLAGLQKIMEDKKNLEEFKAKKESIWQRK